VQETPIKLVDLKRTDELYMAKLENTKPVLK